MDGTPDFAALAQAARTAPTPANLDRLWGAMFALDLWSFIPVPGPGGQFSPFVSVVGAQRWALTFADPRLAAEYAIGAQLAIPGHAPLLQLAPRAAAVHLPGLRAHGVLGLLVHPGPDAFVTPFENLRPMLDHFLARPAPPPTHAPAAHAKTMPVPKIGPPTQRLARAELLALVQSAADDSARVPHAVAALRLEPQWYVLATKGAPPLPALEILPDGRMAAQVYTDERTAETMQRLMAVTPDDLPPVIPMTPAAAIARFGREDMVELVVFNPRGEHLLVPLAQLA